MTEASLLPEAAAAAGIGYAGIVRADHRAFATDGAGRSNESDEPTPARAKRARLESAAAPPATSSRCPGPVAQGHAASQSPRAGHRLEGRARLRRFAPASISACSFGAKRLFFENPDYRLSQIEVQTDGTLQRDQILKAAGLREGENIFSVNLAQVHDRLQQLPQVDEVQVVRKMPGEIDIRIVERKPIAWITSDKQISDPFASDVAFLVDARGVLMKEKKLLPEYLGLPLITGCTSESLEAGKIVESFEAKAALELLRLSTRSFMQTRFQIREIDVSKGYCLLVSDKNHTRVTFGFDNLDTQLQRLEQFLVYSDDSKRELETVNLLVQRNIPVTFAQKRRGSDQRNDRSGRLGAANSESDSGSSPGKNRTGAGAGEVAHERTPPPVRKAIPVQAEQKGLSEMASSDLMVGLEIGTSKICVVVGEGRPDGTIKILGVGQAPSRGVRKGEIVDFETAMKCVHEAVVDAETKSDVMIRSVYVGVAGSHIQSFNNRGCGRRCRKTATRSTSRTSRT